MLFTDLCFGFCPPLLSPFPASFLHTSAPPFTHLFSLHLDSFRPLILHTSLNTLSLSCTFTPNFFHLLFLSTLLPLLNPTTPTLILHHLGNHLPPRPTLGGLISTFVSPLPPPLLLLFLSSALRSLSLKMVTPQSLFTLFGMFNLYYSICISLSVNPVVHFLQWCRGHTYFSISFCIFEPSSIILCSTDFKSTCVSTLK